MSNEQGRAPSYAVPTKHPPTPEQAEIIAAVARGESIIVNALAGAAKSTTIEMAAGGVVASSALALAFNKKIAEELGPRLPFPVKTLNALGHAAWGKAAGKLTLDSEKMAKLRKEKYPNSPWEIGRVISMAKMAGLVSSGEQGQGCLIDSRENWEDIADDLDFPMKGPDGKDWLEACRDLLRHSITLARSGLIDFDDQVYMSTCFGGVFQQYHTVFVDEAQDLSPLNHLMLKRLRPKQLVAVGDPLQSIYAFRGADTDSMPKLQRDWELKEYRLSICFRCSKAVAGAAREWAHDIKSPDWAIEGAIHHVPEFKTIVQGQRTLESTWVMEDLPRQITILCRNNAPIVKLGLRLFKTRKIAFLNARLASSLLSTLRQICAYEKTLTTTEVAAKIDAWRTRRIQTEEPKKHERILDTADALLHCAEAAETYLGLEEVINRLFQNREADIWFGTGHGAKGLEWDHVLHLDSWRLPSKWAQSPAALQQEANLAYVITTRAKRELWFADLDAYKEREK